MNGPQTLEYARELRSDPDFLELSEDIAEAVRTLLFENNDGWEDRLTDIASGHLMAMGIDPAEDASAIDVATSIANTQLKILLQGALLSVLVKGDWL